MNIYITYEHNNCYKGWNIVTDNELIQIPFASKIHDEQEKIAKIINKQNNATVYYDSWYSLGIIEYLKEKCPNAKFLDDRYVYDKINDIINIKKGE